MIDYSIEESIHLSVHAHLFLCSFVVHYMHSFHSLISCAASFLYTAPENKLFCCSYRSVGRMQWSPNDGCDDDRRERAQPDIGETMAFALAGSVLSPLSVITVFRVSLRGRAST